MQRDFHASGAGEGLIEEIRFKDATITFSNINDYIA
jgi:hypothetical protein